MEALSKKKHKPQVNRRAVDLEYKHPYMRKGWYKHLFGHLIKPGTSEEFRKRFNKLAEEDSKGSAVNPLDQKHNFRKLKSSVI